MAEKYGLNDKKRSESSDMNEVSKIHDYFSYAFAFFGLKIYFILIISIYKSLVSISTKTGFISLIRS